VKYVQRKTTNSTINSFNKCKIYTDTDEKFNSGKLVKHQRDATLHNTDYAQLTNKFSNYRRHHSCSCTTLPSITTKKHQLVSRKMTGN